MTTLAHHDRLLWTGLGAQATEDTPPHVELELCGPARFFSLAMAPALPPCVVVPRIRHHLLRALSSFNPYALRRTDGFAQKTGDAPYAPLIICSQAGHAAVPAELSPGFFGVTDTLRAPEEISESGEKRGADSGDVGSIGPA